MSQRRLLRTPATFCRTSNVAIKGWTIAECIPSTSSDVEEVGVASGSRSRGNDHFVSCTKRDVGMSRAWLVLPDELNIDAHAYGADERVDGLPYGVCVRALQTDRPASSMKRWPVPSVPRRQGVTSSFRLSASLSSLPAPRATIANRIGFPIQGCFFHRRSAVHRERFHAGEAHVWRGIGWKLFYSILRRYRNARGCIARAPVVDEAFDL